MLGVCARVQQAGPGPRACGRAAALRGAARSLTSPPPQVDALEWSKMRPYFLYVVAFAAGILCNLKALAGSNIETVIVFRSCTPLTVAGLDYLVLGRELPSPRSFGALLLILLGAVGYVLCDSAFLVSGFAAYGWVTAYFVLLCFQMTYGKQLLDMVPLKSTWGPVLYTNVLSIPPTIVLGLIMGDHRTLGRVNLLAGDALWTGILSCIIGIGIGYTGWLCRAKVSATTYTLVGVLNKLATVLLSALIWESSTSTLGMLSLLLTIVGGALYEQSPLRNVPRRP